MDGDRVGFVLIGLIAAIIAAVLVGPMLSDEAIAVIVGVVCGVIAAIPTSILLLVVFTRRDRKVEQKPPHMHYYGGSVHTTVPRSRLESHVIDLLPLHKDE